MQAEERIQAITQRATIILCCMFGFGVCAWIQADDNEKTSDCYRCVISATWVNNLEIKSVTNTYTAPLPITSEDIVMTWVTQ